MAPPYDVYVVRRGPLFEEKISILEILDLTHFEDLGHLLVTQPTEEGGCLEM
jgi:hypothetical protein